MSNKIKDRVRKTKEKMRGLLRPQHGEVTPHWSSVSDRAPSSTSTSTAGERKPEFKTSPGLATASNSSVSPVEEAISAHTSVHTTKPSSTSRWEDVGLVAGGIGSTTVADLAAPLVAGLSAFVSLVEVLGEIHPFAKMACIIITSVANAAIAQASRDEAMKRLLKVVVDTYTFVNKHYTVENLDDGREILLKELSLQTVDCAYFLRDHAKIKSFFLRAGKNAVSGSTLDSQITDYNNAFTDLQRRLTSRGVLETEIRVISVLKSLSDIGTSVNLMNLTHVRGAGLNSGKACLPGTRISILNELSEWVNDPDGARVRFLLGLAGTGKSSIGHSLGLRFKTLGRLGCFFAFDRNFQGDRHPESVLCTIAHELAGWNLDFKRALAQALQNDGTLSHSADIAAQWEDLIIEPAKCVTFIGPVLIVIDAFDESDSVDGRSRRLLLRRLSDGAASLPNNFRILITSRPEEDVMSLFRGKPAQTSSALLASTFLDDHVADARSDIEMYIRHTLKLDNPDGEDLDEARIISLAQKAEGLFQWAATACRVILTNRAGMSLQERYDDRLADIVHGGPSSLDGLYTSILQSVFPTQSPIVRSRFHSVMAMILCASQPLSGDTLQTIRSHADTGQKSDVALIVQSMGALLSGVSDHLSLIRPIHTSFRDFLLDKSRSGPWHVDPREGHTTMCLGLLSLMNRTLCFNLCNLESSYIRNSQISKLRERVTSPGLAYAANYLGDHIPLSSHNLSANRAKLLSLLRELLCDKFLFWLELLSVLQHVREAFTVLQVASALFLDSGDENMSSAFQDTISFVRRFSLPISQSAPHIYISALPFAPEASLTRRAFLSAFARIPKIHGTSSDWSRMLTAFHAKSSVYAVAWSTSGFHIASGSSDSIVRIWNAYTGELFGSPLHGHSARVNTLAFSPDGSRIVSGSNDSTLRQWDVAACDGIGGPIRGHDNWVESVVYSPDGRRILSGSWDATLRLWDAATGDAIGMPLRGHSSAVLSVAYLPDGDRIISGSRDHTIRVWDAATGQSFRELQGHSAPVCSIACSPDGHTIVSSSSDGTLRTWDVNSGEGTSGPLRGHSDRVLSAVFSPNGRYIVSCSFDATICIWDAGTDKPVIGRLLDHSSTIYSVAYAPDNRRIVSGSSDGTVRIWNGDTSYVDKDKNSLPSFTAPVHAVSFSHDARRVVAGSSDSTLRVWAADTGESAVKPLRGHSGPVFTTAYSPDGRRIASGSYDKELRIWDAETFEAIGEPLRGHSRAITFIVFSPDGRYIASAARDSSIRLWDAGTGDAVGEPLRGHRDDVNAISYSPDSLRLVSSSKDLTLRIWSMETRETISELNGGHSRIVQTVAFSPNNRNFASGSADSTLRIWDAGRGEVISEPLRGHSDAVFSAVYSPDGLRIASGSADFTIRIWNANTGEATNTVLHGHSLLVGSISFSPDGRYLVSGSHDGTVRVWTADACVYDNLSSTSVGMDSPNRVHCLESDISARITQDQLPLQNFQHTLRAQSNKLNSDVPIEYPTSQMRWEDGWIIDSAGNLLIWVPDEYRCSLSWPGTRTLIGGHEPRITIDFDDVAHGGEWAKCRT